MAIFDGLFTEEKEVSAELPKRGGVSFDGLFTAGRPTREIDDAKSRIARNESGGNYRAIGPVANDKGQRAYGKYQVMDFNIPSWTKEALGKSMTPQQFLNDPQAQEKVFEAKFNQYVREYGSAENAAKVWFGGPGALKNPSAMDVLGTTVSEYARKFRESAPVSGAVGAYKSVEVHPKKLTSAVFNIEGLKEGAKLFNKTVNDSFARLERLGEAWKSGESPLELGARAGEGVVGLANLVFSPITVGLTAISTQPVVGHAADKVNQVFAAIAGGASEATIQYGVNNLPVSESTKERLRPVAGELAGLIAQIAAGKGGAVTFTKAKARARSFTEQVQKDVEVQLKIASESGGTTKVPIKTPSSKHAEYARSQGYEPYTRPEDLPIIKFGSRAKTTEPVISLREKTSLSLPKGTRLVRERPQLFDNLFKQEQKIPTARDLARELPKEQARQRLLGQPEQSSSATGRVTAPAAEVPVQKPIGEGQVKESRLAAGVEELAIEKRLTEAFDGRPEYAQLNMKEQARAANEFLSKEPDRAMRVAMGEEIAPAHLTPEAVFIAIENRALKQGDVATLRQLATDSQLSLQATAMGQRIRTLGERDQLSPVRIMEDVRKGREEAFEKKTGKKVEKAKQEEIAKMKDEMKKKSSSRQDWGDFIKEIQCGY